MSRKRKQGDIGKKPRNDTSSKGKRLAKKRASARRVITPKTRNVNTMTEGQFFQKIRSALRRTFRFWKPITDAAERAARPYSGPNKRQKKEYQCNHCKNWFMRKYVQVDHIVECGALNKYEDIVPFIINLTKENPSDYQVLCKECHSIKTKAYLKAK